MWSLSILIEFQYERMIGYQIILHCYLIRSIMWKHCYLYWWRVMLNNEHSNRIIFWRGFTCSYPCPSVLTLYPFFEFEIRLAKTAFSWELMQISCSFFQCSSVRSSFQSDALSSIKCFSRYDVAIFIDFFPTFAISVHLWHDIPMILPHTSLFHYPLVYVEFTGCFDAGMGS